MPRRAKTQDKPLNMAPLSLRLSQPQLVRLRKLAERTGLGMSEIVRRAVDDYEMKHRQQAA
jgi:predicted DNA-binding protein